MARQNNTAIDEVNEMLSSETISIFERNRLKEYLAWASEFSKYSARNQALIHHQNPEATMVAGYGDWEKQGRHVLKGQKGIKIFAAMRKKRVENKKDANGNIIYGPNGKPETEITWEHIGWTVKYVFDVSQTAGKPVPSLTTMLHGKVDGYEEVVAKLSHVSPAPVEFKCRADEFGYPAGENAVVLNPEWTQQQTLQILLPSVAAAIMSQNGPVVSYDSLEAESAAYVVAKHMGIDADYDFDYIADWKSNKDAGELVEALAGIMDTARTVITSMQPEIARR